jgi:L-ribulose-5-phosphate 4-epimerase
VTRDLLRTEVNADYEAATGRVIVECMNRERVDPGDMPAVLVAGHGPFIWGGSPQEALENSIILEQVATVATHQLTIGRARPLQKFQLERHFTRKHGPGAYYGQRSR